MRARPPAWRWNHVIQQEGDWDFLLDLPPDLLSSEALLASGRVKWVLWAWLGMSSNSSKLLHVYLAIILCSLSHIGKDACEIFCCMYQSNFWAGFEFCVYFNFSNCVVKHHMLLCLRQQNILRWWSSIFSLPNEKLLFNIALLTQYRRSFSLQ